MISSGPDSSRSSSRSAPGACNRSTRCLTYSAGYCSPIRPDTENSSSRRLMTTVVECGKWSSWPAWSMCRCVCRIQRTSFGSRPYFASCVSSTCSLLIQPSIPRRCMISGLAAPVSTRIGASPPRIRWPKVGTRRRMPMSLPRTRKLVSSSISISDRTLISRPMDPSSSSPASANWEATFPPPTIHRFAVAA
jgi:hypothetical protein